MLSASLALAGRHQADALVVAHGPRRHAGTLAHLTDPHGSDHQGDVYVTLTRKQCW